MNKAVFFDRDGTINIDKGYVYKIEDFEFIPGAIELLKYYKSQGYLLVLITNQSGIARGYYTEEDLFLLHSHMQRILAEEGVAFDKIYYCPHHPDGIISKYRKACTCRKPGNLLFLKAIQELNISPEQSIAIGDKDRDLIPAKKLGIECFFVSEEICKNMYAQMCCNKGDQE